VSPQGYAYVGPVGVLAEYVASTQRVRLGAVEDDLTIWSWQIAGSVVLTGEKASFKGVTPARPVGRGGFGAVEIAGRYGELNPEADALAGGFADRTKSADRAQAWAVGANYHASRNVKVQLNFERTTFTGGGKEGDRPDESAFLTRLQLVL
jgi:phosphate-selective porin OprO/OprP